MKREAICPVCGKHFTAGRRTQRYCSTACRKYDYRKRPREAEAVPDGAPVIRSFRCLRCGALVSVTDPSDRRKKFCSSHCERLYWKHRRGKTSPPEDEKLKKLWNLYRRETHENK